MMGRVAGSEVGHVCRSQLRQGLVVYGGDTEFYLLCNGKALEGGAEVR